MIGKRANICWVGLLRSSATGLLLFAATLGYAQRKDTAITLEHITVSDPTDPAGFKSSIPAQHLGRQVLQSVATHSVGDAARYFSGVLIKDYGGVGGLKTISVRGLGASSAGIQYDGIPVSDLQTGQIDLSRFSSTFVQSIDLYQAAPSRLLSPAQSFASTSVLTIKTDAFNPLNFDKTKWEAGFRAGSFGLWQPYGGIYLPLKSNTVISANAEAIFSKGNYPFFIDNGSYSEKTRRTNSNVKSLQTETNLAKQFKDSSLLQIKFRSYHSDRGLPGSVIFFNSRSAQKLQNNDVFLQGRYRKQFSESSAFSAGIKYSNGFTRYTDPDFLNNQGGLDSRYTQQEWYATASISYRFTPDLSAAFASDVSVSRLAANTANFVEPHRTGIWNSLSVRYMPGNFEVTGVLLRTSFHDKVKSAGAKLNHEKYTPTLSFSFRPEAGPFLIRTFYKQTFRMPTFNDLYYNFIGNRNLRPESLTQYNLGITFSKGISPKVNRISVSVDGYFNSIRDKIVAIPMQNLFNWTMLNVGKVHIKGIDVNAEGNVVLTSESGLFARVAYTWQQAIDVTNPQSGVYKNRIPYTPDHSGSAVAVYTIKRWSFAYSLLFSGERYALGANDPSNRLNAWASHDISMSHSFPFSSFAATVKGSVNNLTNNFYDVIRYFPMPGRTFQISIIFNHL